MVDHELFVGEIPIGTPLIDLRGHQCILAFGHAQLNGVRWERCEHESAAVVAVSCTACGQGGLMPVCKQHAAQLSQYAQEQVPGRVPQVPFAEHDHGRAGGVSHYFFRARCGVGSGEV